MIKYKLIKEYPTSPELGTILSWDSNNDTCESKGNDYWIQLMYVIDYPEYWEQIEDFKVGEYITIIDSEFENKDLVTHKIISDEIWKFGFLHFDCVNNKNEIIQISFSEYYIRLATNEEIIKYYEEQGWVKGTKFRCGGDEDTVSELQYHNGNVHVKFKEANEWKEIYYCKLIKEPDYPKSWDDVKYLIEDEKIYLDSLVKIYPKSNIKPFDNFDYLKYKYATYKQSQSSLAFAQLTQLHKVMIDKYNEFYNTNWKWEPDWTDKLVKYCIVRIENDIKVAYFTKTFQHLAFPTKELAEFSLQHHNNLWKQYYELD